MHHLKTNAFCYHNVDGHRYALVHMPKLEVLDMSENPIEDDEIRVTLLIDTLSTLKRPLKPLSVADNDPTSAGLSG
ncbi:hypothetical protein ACFX2I_035479 [Malus domestica]|uniref:Uncharacterized protein n=1 Tax=Malus domestica TaxID=3750 RepID=A0A498JRS1_MALDO|nr:hypothetical protein DVH24_010465 [Malus domestica]